MKSIVTLLLSLFAMSGLTESIAQDAEVFFVNNNNAPEAARLDMEIRVMPEDTVFVRLHRIRYQHSSRSVNIPSSKKMKLRFLQSATGSFFCTIDSCTFNPKEFSVQYVSGTENDRRVEAFTAFHHPQEQMKVKYNFRQSKLSLDETDLIIRWTKAVMEAKDRVSGFLYDDEVDDSDYYFDKNDK